MGIILPPPNYYPKFQLTKNHFSWQLVYVKQKQAKVQATVALSKIRLGREQSVFFKKYKTVKFLPLNFLWKERLNKVGVKNK